VNQQQPAVSPTSREASGGDQPVIRRSARRALFKERLLDSMPCVRAVVRLLDTPSNSLDTLHSRQSIAHNKDILVFQKVALEIRAVGPSVTAVTVETIVD
jgi:hypothetical protein